jgi:hypothetical protein
MSTLQKFHNLFSLFSMSLEKEDDGRLLTDTEFRSWISYLREFYPYIFCLTPSTGEVKQFFSSINKKIIDPSKSEYDIEDFVPEIPRLLIWPQEDISQVQHEYSLTKIVLVSVLNGLAGGVTVSSVSLFKALFCKLKIKDPRVEYINVKLAIFRNLYSKCKAKKAMFVVVDWSSVEGLMLLENFKDLIDYPDKIVNAPVQSGNLLDDNDETTGSLEVVKKAFKMDYQNGEIVQHFIEYLDRCYAAWNPTDYYSAYSAVINASMVGKSRMLCKVADEGIFLFLVCLRKEGHKSIPPRSLLIANEFKKMDGMTEYEAQSFVFQYIIACISVLIDWLKNLETPKRTQIELAKMWFNYQKTGDSKCLDENTSFTDGAGIFWTEVLKKITNRNAVSGDFKKLKAYYIGMLGNVLTELVEMLKEKHGIVINPSEVSLLYAFDEARSLINETQSKTSFHIVRRSFSIVQKNGKFPGQFAILTDTTSNVANFVPIRPWDDSERLICGGKKMFEPFFAIKSLDAFAESLNTPDRDLTLKSLELGYTKYGRPAFHAMTKADSHGEILQLTSELLDILACKIVAARNPVKISNEQAVAILSILVPVNIAASHHLAAQLVSSNMRFCCCISEDRKLVYTAQLAEPTLARAALKLAVKHGWDIIINQFSNLIGSAVMDKGYSGELAMQICCIAAFAKSHGLYQEKDPLEWAKIKSVTMTSFLNSLLSDKVYQDILQLLEKEQEIRAKSMVKRSDAKREVKRKVPIEMLDRMVVRVGQFVKFNSDVTQLVLLEYFKRGCGILCKTNNPGCDLIIPVFCSDDPDAKLIEESMTCMTIQVKVLQDRESGGKFLYHVYHGIRPSHCGIEGLPEDFPYISLYADFGGFGNTPSYECSQVISHDEVINHTAIAFVNYSIRQIFHEVDAIGKKMHDSMQVLMKPVLPDQNKELSLENDKIVKDIFKFTHNWGKSTNRIAATLERANKRQKNN